MSRRQKATETEADSSAPETAADDTAAEVSSTDNEGVIQPKFSVVDLDADKPEGRLALQFTWSFPGRKAVLETTMNGRDYVSAGEYSETHSLTMIPIEHAHWPRMTLTA